LQWGHGQGSYGRPCQIDQCRGRIATPARRAPQIVHTSYVFAEPEVLRTNRESWDCQGCRCVRRYWAYNCQADAAFPICCRMRIGALVFPVIEIGDGARIHRAWISPKSSAMNGRVPNSFSAATKKSPPGPGAHWPLCAVAAPLGMCQAAANARK
jgi:hypothetical protein